MGSPNPYMGYTRPELISEFQSNPGQMALMGPRRSDFRTESQNLSPELSSANQAALAHCVDFVLIEGHSIFITGPRLS